ncbi:MAG: tyrosine-type recombinase/integrase [Thermodesulfobacteriota bacterium]
MSNKKNFPLIDEFSSWQRTRELSPISIETYNIKLRKYAAWLEAQQIQILEVTAKDLDIYFQYLLIKDRLASSTRASYYTAIKIFYDYLEGNAYIEENPTAGVKPPRKERTYPGCLTNDEITLMLHAPDRKTDIGRRDMALLALLTATGVRVSALCNLRLEDIKLEEISIPARCPRCEQVDYTGRSRLPAKKQQIHIITLKEKGKKSWTIPVSEKAILYLNLYLNEREHGKDSPIVFVSSQTSQVRPLTRQAIWALVRKYARRAGITARVTPHSFRYAVITWLLDCGVDSMTVRDFVGHNFQATTELYKNRTHRALIYAGAHAERNLLAAIETPLDAVLNKRV